MVVHSSVRISSAVCASVSLPSPRSTQSGVGVAAVEVGTSLCHQTGVVVIICGLWSDRTPGWPPARTGQPAEPRPRLRDLVPRSATNSSRSAASKEMKCSKSTLSLSYWSRTMRRPAKRRSTTLSSSRCAPAKAAGIAFGSYKTSKLLSGHARRASSTDLLAPTTAARVAASTLGRGKVFHVRVFEKRGSARIRPPIPFCHAMNMDDDSSPNVNPSGSGEIKLWSPTMTSGENR